jgi:HK97 family phage portal protein
MELMKSLRRLAGREIKAPSAGRLVSLSLGPEAAWTPRRYDRLAEAAYRHNVVAYRAISEVVRGAASVPWRLYRRAVGERQSLAMHPLIALLARPNPRLARAEFVEAVLGFYLIAGNSYIEALGDDGAAPRELWPLRPDRMRVLKGPTGVARGYEFVRGGERIRWPVDPVSGRSAVLHVRSFNPLDDWYGQSPIEAAATAIDQRNAADAWNMALLQNGARPSGALVYAPSGGEANLSDEQFERLKSQLEEQQQGARNAGRPLLLEGGLDWKEMSLSPKDMDFLEAKHASARDIAQAFGVPPMLLGIPGDNTYANYREARLALWEETVVPLLRHLRDALNAWLVPMFAADLELDLDLDEVPALTLRRERRWDMLRRADFLTVNEKRAAVGYPPLAGGDALSRPFAPRPASPPNDA